MSESGRGLNCLRKVDFTKMNEPQRRAVAHGDGPLLVLAGPGSGKTFTIVNRLLYLTERGVPPEKLLVITFTRDAARSMQRRFQELSGSPGCPVCFGTFHSFFYHILLESGAVGARGILKNSEKKALLLPILKQYSESEPAEDLKEAAERILSALSYYKNTLKPDESLKRIPPAWQPHFRVVADAYAESVKRTGKIDFDDMLSECRQLLQENAEVRAYWQERFSHILIDEFQDINPVQYSVIKLLSKEPRNIFAVGDDDQAIYGFRGAEPDCMRLFQEDFGAEKLLLDINYRSGKEIVQASLAVIGENKNRFHKELQSAQESVGTSAGPASENVGHCSEGGGTEVAEGVLCTGFENREDQYRYLSRALERTLEAGESCAVLFRTNAYMQGLAARLSSRGIPYEIRENAVSIYEHFMVKDILAYLDLAHGVGDRESFLRIVNRPSRYVGREAVAVCGADIAGLIRYYERENMPPVRRMQVLEGLGTLGRQLRMMGGLSPRLAVEFCLKAVGYERYLREKAAAAGEGKLQEWRELLEWLKEDAAQYDSVKKWREGREEYGRALESGKGRGRDRTAVQLMTVHSAKGLEYDRVWIPDCNERIFPHGKLPDEATVEEERRLFYVGMTRAKKYLGLLYLTGTRERPRQPSRFLNALPSHIFSRKSTAFGYNQGLSHSSSTSSSNSQLSRYSSKASATLSYSSSSSI